MPRLIRGIFLYWHFSLDVIITQFLAIYFASEHRFDLAAGIAITDSLLKVFFALPFAAISSRLSLFVRVTMCAYLRPALTAVWLIALFLHNARADTALLIFVFVTFKLLALIDTALSSDFNFAAKDVYAIDLSQSNSIQNIVSRGSIAIAPAFSLAIVNRYLNVIYALGLTLLATAAAVVTLRSIYRIKGRGKSVTHTSDTLRPFMSSIFALIENTHMRWGFLYQIFINFSFGGINYLMIIKLNSTTNSLLNPMSAMYGLFFIYSIFISFLGDRVILATRLTNIPQIVAATGTLSIMLAIAPSLPVELVVCAAMGFLYAYELATVQKVLLPKLRGNDYIHYSALSKISGRAASAVGIAVLGACIQMGIPGTALFFACGISGLCCAFALHAFNPEREAGWFVSR